ncbi:MAG: NAD(P)/FAD-dependent oxidoreductase [Deltaproteobacteria bacterium]|nr:NAD(P)/FAD-dependent oxidoreductase [Deltaproteobacteria bacterium]
MGDSNGEILEVVIVGGGLSGIGAACHLRTHCPGKSFAILEARERIGGTWDLFRYPGVRSDSDMHTLGYAFKPWRGRAAIAEGESILDYVRETAREHDLEKQIRFGHRLRRAAWSSAENLWTLEIERSEPAQAAETGASTGAATRAAAATAPARGTTAGSASTTTLRCRFLSMCSGYYRYDRGHAPYFEDMERFRGRIVHPQFWPADLDYAGQRVAVIGSGATAITLVPAMAKTAAHVTMIQRSPSWIFSMPAIDGIALFLRRILPERLAYRLTRAKNVAIQRFLYRQTRTRPAAVRKKLLAEVRRHLGPDFDVERDFTPRYDPWDQRLCLVPDADLFRALRTGRASVVTDRIARFVETGIELESGRKIDADVIVSATGLELEVLGGVEFSADGRRIDFAETWTYKGMMYSDVPNLVQTFGYINASWTLRADLTAEWTCRLLAAMDRRGARRVTPRLREADRSMAARPWIDDFTPSYIQRVIHLFPKQGDRAPWLNTQDYARDRAAIGRAGIEDDVLAFEGGR